jgi:hypothetical protein
VRNILGKLHLANRTQAALYALREGIAGLDDEANSSASGRGFNSLHHTVPVASCSGPVLQQDLAMRNVVAFRGVNRLDDTPSACTEHIVHLHRLDDQQAVALRNLLARPDRNRLDHARQRRGDRLARGGSPPKRLASNGSWLGALSRGRKRHRWQLFLHGRDLHLHREMKVWPFSVISYSFIGFSEGWDGGQAGAGDAGSTTGSKSAQRSPHPAEA